MDTPRSTYLKFPLWPVLLVMLSWPALADELASGSNAPTVLEGDGTITRLISGSFEELFPEQAEVHPDADSRVLALERIDPVDGMTRWLVPDTEDSDVEEPAGLVLDDESGAVFLLWETAINGLHPLLRLSHFEGEIFSSTIDITSGAFADKGTAQLVITREAEGLQSVEEGDASARSLAERTVVVHVVWWQESALGSLKQYTPVVIENGRLSQQATIFDLSWFAPNDITGAAEAVADDKLRDLLAIRPGDTSQTVVLGFLEPTSGRLQTLRMDVVPTALSDLGDEFGAEIVVIGMRSRNRRAIADEVWPLVLDLADDLHESMQLYMAVRLEDLILNSEEHLTDAGLEALGERVSHEILTITAGVEAGGLARSNADMVDATPQLQEGARHVLMVRALSNREAPQIGSPEGAVRFFLSGTGYHALVAWEEEGRVFFRESSKDGWGEVGSVVSTEELKISAIYEMLEQRITSR